MKKKDFDEALVTSVPMVDRFEQIGINKPSFYREVGFAVQICNKIYKIEEVDKGSIFEAVYNAANIGLTLNPVQNLCYLIPRWDKHKNCKVMGLMPSYQGLIKLLTDGGGIVKCEAHPVYKGEVFEYEQGTDPKLKHIPDPFKKGKELQGYYAVATLKDGQKMIETMSMEEIEAIRGKSDSYKSYADPSKPNIKTCIWVEYAVEMGRKTVIKRLAKYLPKGANHDKVSAAIELDNSDYIVRDFDPLGMRIIQLAEKCTEEQEYRQIISRLKFGIPQSEANAIHEEYLMNQPDPVESGNNYKLKDIQNKLDKHT